MLICASERMPNDIHTAYLLLPDSCLAHNWKNLVLMLINAFNWSLQYILSLSHLNFIINPYIKFAESIASEKKTLQTKFTFIFEPRINLFPELNLFNLHICICLSFFPINKATKTATQMN